MSRSVADLRRRAAALSTNGREFVPRRDTSQARENLNEEDDEDIRLERYRTTQRSAKAVAIGKHDSRGKRSVVVFEDCPNDYEIAAKAPPETDRAIKFYSFHLRHFTVSEYPEEYGFIHYALGKVFFADKKVSKTDYEERAKFVENALHHFNTAIEVFDFASHPIMFGVISIFIGQLFRERATMITNRSILAKRGVSVSDSVRIGIAQLEEGMAALSGSKFHSTEYALCSLELGWLYVMQVTEVSAEEGRGPTVSQQAAQEATIIAREQAILALDRALLLSRQACDPTTSEHKPRGNCWIPAEKQSHPHHIRLLLRGEALAVCEGISEYLLGRCYQDSVPSLDNQFAAFGHFCAAVKQGMLPLDWEEWADAHHRAAAIASKNPVVVDPSYGEDPLEDSDLGLVSAAQHLALALRCSSLRPARRLDLLFHLAQVNIARLNMTTDRVPPGKSMLVAIAAKDGGEGMEIIDTVKRCLIEAIKGSTAANMESTQDAYVYFFSCLKLSELRMLEAAAAADLSLTQRDKALEQSVVQLVNALLARSVVDNTELHYIACAQMSYMLFAAKRYYAATKSYGKLLLCLSVLFNRLEYIPFQEKSKTQHALREEANRQASMALLASAKEVTWSKDHLGAIFLTESVTSGFAYWSFESHNAGPKHKVSPRQLDGPTSLVKSMSFAEAVASRAPPKVLPSFQSDTDRVAVEKLRQSGIKHEGIERPPGSVPLWAMGHHPDFEGHDSLLSGTDYQRSQFGYFCRQRRRRVPHLPEIIFKSVNIVTTTNTKRDVVYLMPLPSVGAGKGGSGAEVDAKVSFRIHDQHIEDYIRNKEKAAKVKKSSDAQLKRGRRGNSLFSRFFSSALSSQEEPDVAGPILPPPRSAMFASVQGYYSLMVLSRHARNLLVHTASRLEATKSQRALNSLSLLPDAQRLAFARLQGELANHSTRLHVPSFTLRSLSARTFTDLEYAFQSQVALCRVASNFETLLYTEMIRHDYFLPMVAASQALTRDVGGFDKALLNAQVLIANLRMAEKLKVVRELEEAELKAAAESAASAALAEAVDRKTFGADANDLTMMNQKAAPAHMEEAPRGGKQQDSKETDAGLMTFDLSQSIDGCLHGGTPLMLSNYLDPTECLLAWHLPNVAGQGMQLVLVWKEPLIKVEEAASSDFPTQARTRSHRHGVQKGNDKLQQDSRNEDVDDLVVEVIKTEVDCSQMEFLVKNWLVALQSTPEVKRLAHASDALRSLSCYLALTEVLLLLPAHVDSLVICGPNIFRLIPWHLLFVEISTFAARTDQEARLDPRLSAPRAFHSDPETAKTIGFKGKALPVPKPFNSADLNNVLDPESLPGQSSDADGRISIHLMEKFLVRLGPTLALFEMTEMTSARLTQSTGNHRMCVIDGDEREDREGARAAEVECRSVSEVFSADPDDVTLLNNVLASPVNVTTSAVTHISNAERAKKTRLREMKRKQREARKVARNKAKEARQGMSNPRYIKDVDTDSDEMMSDSNDDLSSDDEEAISNRRSLRECRVLHFAAHRADGGSDGSGLTAVAASRRRVESIARKKKSAHAAVQDLHMQFSGFKLPMYYGSNGEYGRDDRDMLTSRDLLKQVHLSNCALCTASRFCLSDGVDPETRPQAQVHEQNLGGTLSGALSMIQAACDRNVEVIDALHLAGACTVLYPLWGTVAQGGIGTIASTVLLIRFYSDLPTMSRLRRSVAHALWSAMQWLRERTADETIAFIARCPIKENLRNEIIEEIEALIQNCLKDSDKALYAGKAYDEQGNKVRPGDRKFFSHFLSWGAFAVSGSASSVHPRDLTEVNENPEETSMLYDRTLDDANMEISILKTEGRWVEARMLEHRLWQTRLGKVVEGARKAGRATVQLVRRMKDSVEAMDKALLDQDSDGLSVSSEGEDNDGVTAEKHLRGSRLSENHVPERDTMGSTTGGLRTSSARTLFTKTNNTLVNVATPISSLTSYIEGLFADHDHGDGHRNLRPRRLLSVKESGSTRKENPRTKNTTGLEVLPDTRDIETDLQSSGDVRKEMLDLMPTSKTCTLM